MKLKVCGMKYNTADVASLRPDYLGFIFWEPSARYFKGSMPELDPAIKKVGVFVNAAPEEIVMRTFEYNLQLIQLHGQESPDYCRDLKLLLAGENTELPEIVKAFALDENFDFELLTSYEDVCDYFLFDTRSDLPGGSGKKFNWKLLSNYRLGKPFFLSGGIGSQDVESIKEFSNQPGAKYCYGIDVNSKFEKEPGLKDTKSLEEFMSGMGLPKKEKL